MKILISFLVILWVNLSYTQIDINGIKPQTPFDNISVKSIASDSLQSNFIIWVNKTVPCHYHQFHTETIYVLQGKATMFIKDSTFKIKKGDFVVIPPNHAHGVTHVHGRKTLKILSTQAPRFDGQDRIPGKP